MACCRCELASNDRGVPPPLGTSNTNSSHSSSFHFLERLPTGELHRFALPLLSRPTHQRPLEKCTSGCLALCITTTTPIRPSWKGAAPNPLPRRKDGSFRGRGRDIETFFILFFSFPSLFCLVGSGAASGWPRGFRPVGSERAGKAVCLHVCTSIAAV